jgi:spore germination cell wall hydrolase CwlJ-like protein
MSLLQRAATFAAMTLVCAGLIGVSSPGLAEELDRSAISATVLGNNPLMPAIVPVTPAPATPTVAPAAPSFDSLDDAVAAQDPAIAASTNAEALRCLAGAVYFESKGEPLAGQLAVANVIINRTKSGRFPADICDVVTQRGQFSFVRGGEIPDVDAGRATYRKAVAVAKVALNAAWESPAAKALYFNAVGRRPSGAARVASIGNHIFYR